MKHITFYEEFFDKRKRLRTGNCLAVARDNRCPDGAMECIGAVFSLPNSPCAGTSVAQEFLREKCRRVSRARAFKAHPMLDQYLHKYEDA